MRLIENDPEADICLSGSFALNLSMASDTSSRSGSTSGSASVESGTVRNDLIWNDVRFNTKRAPTQSQRQRSPDSQSSETGSECSGSVPPRGNAYIDSSSNGSGRLNCANKAGLGLSQDSGYQTDRNMDDERIHSDPVGMNFLVSYDHSLMIHAVRRQKALAHYQELIENGTVNTNNKIPVQSSPHKTYPEQRVYDSQRLQYKRHQSYDIQRPGYANRQSNFTSETYTSQVSTDGSYHETNRTDSWSPNALQQSYRDDRQHANRSLFDDHKMYNGVQSADYGESTYSSDISFNRYHSSRYSNLSDRTMSNTNTGYGETAPPARPPRLQKPMWKPNIESGSQDPPSHPFYLPETEHMPSLIQRDSLPQPREAANQQRHDTHHNFSLPHDHREFAVQPEDNLPHLSKKKTPEIYRDRARDALSHRAFSLDLSVQRVPDFPCHRAAMDSALSGPTTPVKERPNGLNKSWHGYTTVIQPEVPLKHSPNAKNTLKSITEGMAEMLLKSPKVNKKSNVIERSPTVKSRTVQTPTVKRSTLTRSSSAPNHLDEWTEDEESRTEDDDSNDDDYGFRNHPSFKHLHAPDTGPPFPTDNNISGDFTNNLASGSTGMQKAKSPAATRRILPKRWRKSKTISSSSKHVSIWSPEGGCVWNCKNGRQVTLSPVSLLTLTEIERVSLQKIAQAKLQTLDLGCPIPIPKDWFDKRSKKSTFSSLRKRTASTSALENKGKDSRESSVTFGIPLGKCIANDIEFRRRRSYMQDRTECLDSRQNNHLGDPNGSSKSQSTDVIYDIGHRHLGSNLLEALSLSTSGYLDPGMISDDERSPLAVHIPQVPRLVTKCCKHIETYGLRVLGIFRIGSSKKRSKQLRDEVDTNGDIIFGEDHNPHDVAALLKEYFRDLPDPIFTRDLYTAFVATRKIKNDETRLTALTLLVALLPAPNRDTLWALLHFLHNVAQHSTDVMTSSGQLLPGNKMDSTNLATLFGPNLLHKAKGGEFQVESVERAEERKDVIAVLQELIEHKEVFKLHPQILDELYRRLLESNPEAVDFLLKKRAYMSSIRLRSERESVSSTLDDSEESSMSHSPGYASTAISGYPRTLTEAMQMSTAGAEASPGSQLRIAPQEGPMVYQTSPSPVGTPRGHRPASRVRSDDTPAERKQDITLVVPVQYRLSAPDASEWCRRSLSPGSPRVSPCPKAMKAGTPEFRHKIDDTLNISQDVSGSQQNKLAVSVPHGPEPDSRRVRPRNTLTVPADDVSRARSVESCSSASSTGYLAGSSRSGTNSPLTTEHVKKWYLETPPDSPGDNAEPSPFHRTSSTHRPLNFNVSGSTTTLSSPRTLATHASGTVHQPVSSPYLAQRDIPPSPGWEKQRWNHWEKLTKEKSLDQQEQETLV